MRKSLLLATATAAAVGCAVVAGTSSAAPASPRAAASTPSEIYACQNRKTGALRVVKSAKAKCKRGEKKTKWAVAGPAGPAGPAGATPVAIPMMVEGTNLDVPGSLTFSQIASGSFTGQAGYRYQVLFQTARSSTTCPDATTASMTHRVLLNGTPIPDGLDANGDFASNAGYQTNWYWKLTGAVNVSVIARGTTGSQQGTVAGTCAVPTGPYQLYALAYTSAS